MFEDLPQLPDLPLSSRPIVSIGAGGIVRAAHLPAYRLAGFSVAGVFDVERERAEALAADYGIDEVFDSVEEAVAASPDAIFDLAVPGRAILDVLRALPRGATALVQKPMGENLEAARAIVEECRTRDLTAAVNFQMRDAPYVRLAREIIARGEIGELHDVEVRVTTETPWHLWDFLEDIPRMEILYHSIHYIDTIRSFCGEPRGVYAKTVGHPRMPRIRQARSTILLDYGEQFRATITANHGHDFGDRFQESYIKWEGTKGAIRATMGLNLDYPKGKPDEFWVFPESRREWIRVPLRGSWFPHAFVGPMSSLMRYREGSLPALPTSVEEAFRTMAVVEAAYLSSDGGGVAVPTYDSLG